MSPDARSQGGGSARGKERASSVSAWLTAFRHQHWLAELLVVFCAGFAFDALTLRRIDHKPALIKQGAFLFALALLLAFDQRIENGWKPGKLAAKVLAFRETAIHFFIGALMSLITLFYFKSASGWTSLIFLVVVFAAMLANEFPRFRKLGPVVRFGLFSFCLASYLAFLLPVLLGRMFPQMFVVSACIAALIMYLLVKLIQRWTPNRRALVNRVIAPSAGVLLTLVALYYAKVLPPVPLAVDFIGIYHDVKRAQGEYLLSHEPNDWRIWRHGDQVFFKRDGDRVYCFVRIFAPTNFQDVVRLRWSYDDPKQGWRNSDAIVLPISGGRDKGFRGQSYKSNFWAGDWKVEVLTEDDRELGVIHFSVIDDPRTGPRTLIVDRG